MRQPGSRRNLNFRQIGDNSQEDQPSQSLPQMKTIIEDIGGLRQLRTRNPDGNCPGNEDGNQDKQRESMKHRLFSPALQGSIHVSNTFEMGQELTDSTL